MDRNNAIREDHRSQITDTQRRAPVGCLRVGHKHELWAKMLGLVTSPRRPLQRPHRSLKAPAAEGTRRLKPRSAKQPLKRHTVAIDALVAIVNDKLGGDFEKGLGVLASRGGRGTQRQVRPKEESDGEQW